MRAFAIEQYNLPSIIKSMLNGKIATSCIVCLSEIKVT